MANTTSEFQFDVFLSHSAKDKAVVRPLAERVAMRQHRVVYLGELERSRQCGTFFIPQTPHA